MLKPFQVELLASLTTKKVIVLGAPTKNNFVEVESGIFIPAGRVNQYLDMIEALTEAEEEKEALKQYEA